MTSNPHTPSSLEHGAAIFSRSVIVVLAALLVDGCSRTDAARANPQVAAKVNNDEISVHQVNFLLQRQAGVTAENANSAGREVLERLIDQELALQRAKDLKIDREPVVQQAIEAARRDIVTQAYIQRSGDAATKPTPQEVQAYYRSNPALFAQRRVFTLLDVFVESTELQAATLKDKLGAARTPAELSGQLQGLGLPYTERLSTQPASALPMDLLGRLAALRDGQSLLLPDPKGLRLVLVVSSRVDPLSEEAARPAIEQYLVNDRRRLIAEQEVKALRTGARIEYAGIFADAAPAGDAAK